jgi:ABC-type lipoprotein release transport system permease subunit
MLKMAWRNLWRNQRRTLITMASVFLAVLLALIMRSWQLGSYRKMVRDVVRSYSGYVQIHACGYWDNRTLEYTFTASDSLIKSLQRNREITGLIPRLESFALASGLEQTKGVMVVGIEPDAEQRLTGLAGRITAGRYLAQVRQEVLVTEKLAAFLKVTVGDTLVLLGQGFHGVSAAGKYTISGLVHFASPQLNSQLVFMPLTLCQSFYSAENRLTSLAIDLQNPQQSAEVAALLRREVSPAEYEVMTWDEMQVELVQQIESDNASGLIMLGILYVIVTFGIFGTLTMMVHERRREFGVMLAVGMNKSRLLGLIALETTIMAAVAIILGSLSSIPIIWHYTVHPPRFTGELARAIENFGVEPVLPFLFTPSVFVHQAGMVFILTALAALWPLYSIVKLRTVEALHR